MFSTPHPRSCRTAAAWIAGLLTAVGCSSGSLVEPDPIDNGRELLVSVAQPYLIEDMDAGHVAQFRAALQDVKAAIPDLDMISLFLPVTTTRTDWLALLDAADAERLMVSIGFAVREGSSWTGYRPDTANGQWQLGALGELVSCAECVRHPALYMVQSVDEPWHHEKRPFYTTADLRSMYSRLHELAGAGSGLRVMTQFSRELWRYLVDNPRPGIGWGPGIADVVQISALEFQDGAYQQALLDANHTWSRRIVHEATPDIPLFTSVQVFGSRYGPGPGYWYPRERAPDHDLRRLLDDLVLEKYEREHPLTGIMLQRWDSDDPAVRPLQWTLGDASLPGSPPDQVAASLELRAALNAWLGGR